MEDKEMLLKKYTPMINKFVWGYCQKNKDGFEEMQAQGFLIFCEALETYNENLASFSTHLFNQLRGGFYRYNQKSWKYKNSTISLNEEVPYFDTHLEQCFEAALQEISKEAKEILVFILTANEKLSVGKLQKYFVSTGTFKKIQFDLIIKQLKEWWKNNKNIANFSKTCQNLHEILLNLG